ncbi:MAG: EpsG family protein [Fulvivirga sp.]
MIYIGVFFLVLIFAYLFDFKNYGKNEDFWYKFLLIILIAVSGLRYKVGGDTLAYFDFFEDYPFVSELRNYDFIYSKWDPFWVILSSVSKSIVNDFAFFQIIHAIFINSVIFSFFKKHTQYRFTAVLVYYLFFYIYFNTEVMRESLAVCVFLLAYPYFKDRIWIKYYVLAVLAFLFHSSAIITFIFPLFRNIKLNLKGIIFLCFGFLILISTIFYFPSIIHMILFSERLFNRFEIYSQFQPSLRGMLNIFFYYALVPYLILRFYNKINKGKRLFGELHMLYFALVMVTISISGFARMLNYLTPFMIVFFADFLATIYRKKIFYNLSGQMVFLILIMSTIPKIRYYTADTSRFVSGTHKYNLYHPYSSIFSKEEFPTREIIFRETQQESISREE